MSPIKVFGNIEGLITKRDKISSSIMIGFPFVAYRIQLSSSKMTRNVFQISILALEKVYAQKYNDKGKIIEEISQVLGLDRIFVKIVLKNHQDHIDKTSKKQATDNVQVDNYYIFYDVLQQRFFEQLVTEYDFKRCTPITLEKIEDRFKISQGLGFSQKYEVHYIGSSSERWDYPKLLTDDEVNKLAKEAGMDIGGGSLKYLGLYEPVIVVSKCYYSSRNLTSCIVKNPFNGKGFSTALADNLETYKNYHSDSLVVKALEQLYQEVVRRAQEKLENSADTSKELRKQLAFDYPKIATDFPRLLWRMAELKKSFKTLVQLFQKTTTDEQGKQQIEDAKKRFAVAHHEFLETLFPIAFRLYLSSEALDKIRVELNRIKGLHKKTDQYINYAETVGWIIKPEEADFFRLSDDDVSMFSFLDKLFREQEEENEDNNGKTKLTGRISGFITAMLLEAVFNKNHPVAKLVQDYSNLIDIINTTAKMRNIGKHSKDNNEKVEWDFDKINYYNAFDEYLIELFWNEAGRSKEENPQEATVVDLEQLNAARIGATVSLQAYPVFFNDDNAIKMLVAYELKGADFMSLVYNFMDSCLELVLSESTSAEERIQACQSFSFNADLDSRDMHNVYARYGINANPLERPFKTDGLRKYRNSDNEKLSLGIKLYLLVKIWDRHQPNKLQKLFEVCPGIIKLVYDIYELRGHNTNSDFGKHEEEYAVVKNKVLVYCQYLINLLEVSNNG